MGGGMSGDGVDGGKQDAGDGGKGSPAQGRSYSQAEVDALVAGKLEGFAGVDVEEYRALKVAKARQEREALEKKGDFDKILAQTVKEKDEVIGLREKDISALGEQLRTIRVDNALLAAASAARAISPAQIVTLLKGSVHYDGKTDSVEVRENGAPLYRGGEAGFGGGVCAGVFAGESAFFAGGSIGQRGWWRDGGGEWRRVGVPVAGGGCEGSGEVSGGAGGCGEGRDDGGDCAALGV